MFEELPYELKLKIIMCIVSIFTFMIVYLEKKGDK